MDYPSTSKNPSTPKKSELRLLPLAVTVKLSAAGLLLALVASNATYAQNTSAQGSTSRQSGGEQYKRGETPSGHKYGIIKEGEPNKGATAEDNQGMKEEEATLPMGSIIDRDKRESHEGSGPDPLGRY